MSTRGVVFVHSTPPALCPHIEWAVAGILGARPPFDWIRQPASPETLRAEVSWQGEAGTGSRLASALGRWKLLRFEVTEEPSPGYDGTRYACTPNLGIFAAVTGVHGDILVPEDRLKAAIAAAASGRGKLGDDLHRLLGKPWDDELESFRQAGEGAPVRWLHQVV